MDDGNGIGFFFFIKNCMFFVVMRINFVFLFVLNLGIILSVFNFKYYYLVCV